MKIRFALLGAILVTVVHGSLPAADLKAGLDAYNRGDYETAVYEFQPLADAGVPLAQYSMGKLCEEGRGVP